MLGAMSILHRPMFSKEPPEFPANEAAVRCARMRLGGILEAVPMIAIGGVGGVLISMGELVLGLPLALRRPGRLPIIDLLSNVPRPSVFSLVVGVLLFVVVFAGLPRL